MSAESAYMAHTENNSDLFSNIDKVQSVSIKGTDISYPISAIPVQQSADLLCQIPTSVCSFKKDPYDPQGDSGFLNVFADDTFIQKNSGFCISLNSYGVSTASCEQAEMQFNGRSTTLRVRDGNVEIGDGRVPVALLGFTIPQDPYSESANLQTLSEAPSQQSFTTAENSFSPTPAPDLNQQVIYSTPQNFQPTLDALALSGGEAQIPNASPYADIRPNTISNNSFDLMCLGTICLSVFVPGFFALRAFANVIANDAGLTMPSIKFSSETSAKLKTKSKELRQNSKKKEAAMSKLPKRRKSFWRTEKPEPPPTEPRQGSFLRGGFLRPGSKDHPELNGVQKALEDVPWNNKD